jgi:hypothetical protein
MKRTPGCLLASLGLAACSESCFVTGTLIATPAGPIPIDALVIGNLVWSFSLERREKVARRVRAVLQSGAQEVRVIVAGGHRIAGVTREHPFYDFARHEYRPVRDLLAGDVVATMVDNGIAPCTIDRVAAKEATEPSIRVFNLTIDGPEANYFAAGILVHNKTYPILECSPQGVAITAHRASGRDPEPGDYDVRWTEPPSSRDVRIDRVLEDRSHERRPNVIEVLTPTVDRVYLTTPEPGDYELRAHASSVKDNKPCRMDGSLTFSIAAPDGSAPDSPNRY